MIDAMTSELPFSVSINVPSQSQMMHSGVSIDKATLRLDQEENASETNTAQIEQLLQLADLPLRCVAVALQYVLYPAQRILVFLQNGDQLLVVDEFVNVPSGHAVQHLHDLVLHVLRSIPLQSLTSMDL